MLFWNSLAFFIIQGIQVRSWLCIYFWVNGRLSSEALHRMRGRRSQRPRRVQMNNFLRFVQKVNQPSGDRNEARVRIKVISANHDEVLC